MNESTKERWKTFSRTLKKNFTTCHQLLDNTPELEDSKYLQLVCQLNEFRQDLFSALCGLGIVIPMTEREVAPGDGQRATAKRKWHGALDGQEEPAAVLKPTIEVIVPTRNPFNESW